MTRVLSVPPGYRDAYWELVRGKPLRETPQPKVMLECGQAWKLPLMWDTRTDCRADSLPATRAVVRSRALFGKAIGISAGTLILAAMGLLFAQPLIQGPQMQVFHSQVDDSQQPYALYVPPTLDPGWKYPLVITLHAEDISPQIGLMWTFGQINRREDGSLAGLRLFRPRDVAFLVASPLARGTMGYQGIAEQDVYDVIADVERRFPVDEDRVYLTGVSMGGGGALRLALTRPDVWAAVAPVCPMPQPGLENLAGNALDLPVRLFHGEQDPLVPAESSRDWQRRLMDQGVAAQYLEFPAVRHNAWDYAYRDGALFEWFSRFRRDRFPLHVHYTTESYRYSSAYWVRIDGLTPGVPATIDARQTDPNTVKVETHDLDGFTLTMNHGLAEVSIDGSTLPLRPRPVLTVSFRKQGSRWVRGLLPPEGKSAGSEGPIAEAIAGRHLYVYGTTGNPPRDELELRRKTAETAANWSTPRDRLQLNLKVKPDIAVTDEDLAENNLVLFGNRETNKLIARFARDFPLELGAGAADYGLLFIAPIGKHYALVDSGLPWWTGGDDAKRPVDRFQPKIISELDTFGDYIVFKGSLAHVLTEGRFDRSWKVPADAAAKIKAIGAVSVH